MFKRLVLAALVAAALPAQAIVWQYGSFNATKKTCAITGWSGNQPTSGKLTLPSAYQHSDGVTYTVTAVAAHALDRLTDVTEITIPSPVVKIGAVDNSGAKPKVGDIQNFIGCEVLEKFKVASDNKAFAATGAGMLVSKDATVLYRVPACVDVPGGEATLASKITHVAPGSFAGNTSITTIILPASVTDISTNAGLHLMGNLSKFVVAAGNKSFSVADGALIYEGNTLRAYPRCRTIRNLTVNTKVTDVDAHAFANAKHLESVKFAKAPEKIWEAAFSGCRSLKSFDFTMATDLMSDSIFAGCGFTEVVFDNKNMYVACLGSDMFSGCASLEKIDLSNVGLKGDIHTLTVSPYFVRNAKSLKEIRLPSAVYFSYDVDVTNGNPCIGPDVPLSKLVLGSFSVDDGSCVRYRGNGTFTPATFVKTTNCASGAEWPLAELYQSGDGAVVKPVFYCESYSPADEYISPLEATYYVPGLCEDNYLQPAQTEYAKINVQSMYTLEARKSANQTLFTIRPALEGVTIDKIRLNNTVDGTPNTGGNLSFNTGEVNEFRVFYTVLGEKMETAYPGSILDAADIEEIGAEASSEAVLYDLSGMEVGTDATALPAGVYIRRCGDTATKIYIR